ncbi:hypothetical protein EIN_174160 [Entamoeba invadens IP1]|uniref:Uncharacterized protein n=1 Tax=Entamoeba invadens IP1 TaxID=370355 RepID=A0A0A1TW78_ENTIV|nr:hypothetical protein EIN_174160 [Entamoeba invadens IP1]ELP84741.1 hypothetical protein EIN_174160 [Entamoeba invadens IP1]|eukprot:XP_004184087.1 hypothetical protein EIN_174160 [Entamoeba invadens IP1]
MPTFCHEFSPLLVVTPMHTPMVLEEQENEEETHQSVDQQEDGVFDLDEDIGDDDFEEEESVDSEEQDAINEIMQRVDQLKKDGDKRNKMLGEMIKKNSTTNALY